MMEVINNGDSVTARYRYLHIINNAPKYVIKMLSQPFAGVILTPGERTKTARPVAVGIYRAVYEECKIGNDKCSKKIVNVSIGPNRRDPLIIYEQ